jgi:hypothetical protein
MSKEARVLWGIRNTSKENFINHFDDILNLNNQLTITNFSEWYNEKYMNVTDDPIETKHIIEYLTLKDK